MSVDPELQQFRAAMDVINRRLVDVLHDRARLCRSIGAWKKTRGTAAVDAVREQRMLAAMVDAAVPDGYSRTELTAILQAVFAASRRVVAEAAR